MTWKPRDKTWDWRSHLTKDEAAFIKDSDKELAEIAKARDAYRKKFQIGRAVIVNRAIQRAKYDCRPRSPQESASD